MQEVKLLKRYALSTSDPITCGPADYHLKVQDRAEPDRPREKLQANGPQSLSTAELIAVLLGVGTRKEEVLAMAQRILREYGEQTIVNETNPKRLAETLQIPFTKACQIVASFELGRRYFQHKGGKPVVVRTADQAYAHLRDMTFLNKEQFKGLYLDSRYQVIHEEVISVGSLTASIVHPREVFAPAIERGAVAVIVAHNHPSGILIPTDADITVTRQLQAAGHLLQIELLDHLIIANNTFVSITKESL